MRESLCRGVVHCFTVPLSPVHSAGECESLASATDHRLHHEAAQSYVYCRAKSYVAYLGYHHEGIVELRVYISCALPIAEAVHSAGECECLSPPVLRSERSKASAAHGGPVIR